LGQIVFDDLAQKVAGLVVLFCRGGGGFRHAVILGGARRVIALHIPNVRQQA
jgi:hypothetical protein